MSKSPFGPIATKLSKIEIQDGAWLWPGRIPLGAITTLIGFGGEGKSFLACSIASTVSRGGAASRWRPRLARRRRRHGRRRPPQ